MSVCQLEVRGPEGHPSQTPFLSMGAVMHSGTRINLLHKDPLAKHGHRLLVSTLAQLTSGCF